MAKLRAQQAAFAHSAGAAGTESDSDADMTEAASPPRQGMGAAGHLLEQQAGALDEGGVQHTMHV